MAMNCPKLQSLNVSYTEGAITDDSIMMVATHCLQLHSLDVSRTESCATDASMKLLATNFKQLERLFIDHFGDKPYDSVTITAEAMSLFPPSCRITKP